MRQTYNFAVSVDRPIGYLWKRDGYIDGDIKTWWGIVSVYSQGHAGSPRNEKPHSRAEFVWRGRCYVRSWDVAYSARYLKTLAQRHAAAVARAHP